ncbi:OLC1v1030230C1 [Oldenlandia corymbosa var. corymbosa]|uniref:OLC1v1030230C1 n=1 Tax=Oldenlandia corymbosa var. corymbosa TaxID=529605 RepID=A0AAV1CFF1_OLDCO|nr:OLC1v1030230C1 [Oldenlandia corymbosa var. corymbosa]
MAGIVYLRTNKFEVKLEGIAFKTRDFESLCSVDFLFPQGKTWTRQPVVGVDVMRHPRDPNHVLLFLCFGVGCVILKFNSGDEIPDSIFNFFADSRIRFVGFGIPEKNDIFPLSELGLTEKADVGYLAAKILDDGKYKKCALSELARKILRVKKMTGLTQSSSFERHEQIKSAICQLFITTAIGMVLLGKCDRRKLVGGSDGDDSQKRSTSSFLKNLNQLPLFTEGWFKFPKNKKKVHHHHAEKVPHDVPVEETTVIDGFSGKGLVYDNDDDDDNVVDDHSFEEDDPFHGKSVHIPYGDDDDEEIDADDDDDRFRARRLKGFFDDALMNYLKHKNDNVCPDENNSPCSKVVCGATQQSKPPLKGILKSPSSKYCSSRPESGARTPNSSCDDETVTVKKMLRRANSKGFNVSFKGVDFSKCDLKDPV